MRLFVAVCLLVTLPWTAALAVDVRVEGNADAEAARIAEGVADYLGDLEVAGAPFRYGDGIVVKALGGGRYRIIAPDLSIVAGNDEPSLALGRLEIEAVSKGGGRYAYRLLPFAPIRIEAPGDAMTFQVREQDVHGEWDAELGIAMATTLVWRGVELVMSSGAVLKMELIDSTSQVALSSDGRTISNPSSATIRGIEFDSPGMRASFAHVAMSMDVVDMSVEDYQRRLGFNAQMRFSPTLQTPADMIEQIRDALGGGLGRETTYVEATDVEFTMRSFVDGAETRAVLPLISGRQTVEDGYNYAITLNALRVDRIESGIATPIVTLDYFEGESHTALDGADTVGSSQELRFRGLDVHGPYAFHVPGDGHLAFDAEAIPFAALIEQRAAIGPMSEPSTLVPLLLGVLANSEGALSLHALDLANGGVTAALDSPVRYALSSRRFTTTPNRLEVRGLGGLVAQLVGNAGANQQLIGLLSIAMALGRPEVRNGENVHVYEFGNAPDGSLTINGRPIGGLQ